MSAKEMQEEEVEVLESIYEGDELFKQVDATTYHYKLGEDGQSKSFIMEIKWGDNYPDEVPQVNLDVFYNKHVLPQVKSSITEKIIEQAEQWLGSAMTYTLFEYAKENVTELLEEQPETISLQTQVEDTPVVTETKIAPKVKKEQLSKAQKRKMVNRLDNKGELPRGHDWVDVVKHLCQTGRANNDS